MHAYITRFRRGVRTAKGCRVMLHGLIMDSFIHRVRDRYADRISFVSQQPCIAHDSSTSFWHHDAFSKFYEGKGINKHLLIVIP